VKPKVGVFQLASCSGCLLSHLDTGKITEFLDEYDVKYYPLVMDARKIPEELDLAVFEGAVGTIEKGHMKLVTEIRQKSKKVAALGACAVTTGILMHSAGNQMPMPETDAFLPISELVKVDYAIPGCPPSPEIIERFFDAFLRNDEKYLQAFTNIEENSEINIRYITQRALCISCGLCTAVCPTLALSDVEGKPVLRDEICVKCGECRFQCPRSYMPLEYINETVFKDESTSIDEYLGRYKAIYTVRATNQEILKTAQSGGTTTALMNYCLDSRIIDGILTGGKDKEKYWLARSALVTDYDELLETTGTTYNLCPTLNILKHAATSNYLKNIAIIGLPCVHQAVRKLEIYPLSLRSVIDKISLRVGLFCTHNFRYNAMLKMMEELGEIRAEDTYKVDIGAGNYVIYSVSGDIQKIPIDIVREYEQESCSICPDFTAELSDISIGSIGAAEGWNTVIVRTKTGQKAFEAAVQEGYLEIGKEAKMSVDIELVKKLSKIKKNRSKKKIEKRKMYNLKVPF